MDVDVVRRAAAAIVWEPDFAEVVRTDAFTLVKYPMWLQQHCQAHRLTSRSPADDVIDAALAQACSWSRDTVWFCGLSSATPNPSLEPRLLERGGHVAETLSVLALDLSEGVPDVPVPDDVSTGPVTTPDLVKAWDAVSDEAFENETPNDEDPDVRARACQEEYDQGRGGVFVTVLDGRPAASGGMTFYPDDRLVLLWGGSSTKAARGRGAYRANLLARLRRAHELGYAHAVVKGRVTTSAPILTRVGFVDLGQERVVALASQPSSSPST